MLVSLMLPDSSSLSRFSLRHVSRKAFSFLVSQANSRNLAGGVDISAYQDMVVVKGTGDEYKQFNNICDVWA